MIMFAQERQVVNFTGSYVGGKWVESQSGETTIVADSQPLNGIEIDSLSVGRKELGKIKIYTDEILFVADEITGRNGTYFKHYNNEWYEVISDETRECGLINHKKYIAELRKNTVEGKPA